MMKSVRLLTTTVAALAMGLFAVPTEAKVCEGYGPQTPRDISQEDGDNKVVWSFAPDYDEMNLCNIHFHKHAEHKAKGFSISTGGNGYKCNETPDLSEKELSATSAKGCKDLVPGDTIEVHWVYTSCDVNPGKGLGACLSDACANPNLRVETQVFTVVNDPDAKDFMSYTKLVEEDGYSQVEDLPSRRGAVKFLGSTTGPSFTEEKCSPLQVSWSVTPKCQKVHIDTVHAWCSDNVFGEDHGHGVRQLVTNKKLLSEIDD